MTMNKSRQSAFIIFTIIMIFFGIFLAFPLVQLFIQAITTGDGISFALFREMLASEQLHQAFMGSFTISIKASVIATLIGFIVAYAINFTNIPKKYKKFLEVTISLPMLSPTIVYGFVLIYTFGRQGFLTRLLGFQLFEIYSTTGLLIGFLIYTIPTAFLLINNSMKYIDCQFFTVSELMGDGAIKKFVSTIFMPLLTVLGISVVQTFFLSFTDFGLPASIAGNRPLMSSLLFNQMIGAVPDFTRGAVIAIAMLLPAIISASVMLYLRRFDVKYDKISTVNLKKNPLRDGIFAILTAIPTMMVVLTFSSLFFVPFVESYPFNMGFTLRHFTSTLSDSNILRVYQNSVVMSLLTGLFGVILAFGAALLVRRSPLKKRWANIIEALSQVTNAIPGMVLGVSFLFAFTGTGLSNTLAILVISNVVYFFATPFAMATQALEKLSSHYEKTATLLGDNYLQTLVRVIIPNCKKTLMEIFSYLFIHSMVTISALIFLVGVRTSTVTTQVSALQHFNRFNEIFVLALLLLATNLVVKMTMSLIVKDYRWFRAAKRGEVVVKKTGVNKPKLRKTGASKHKLRKV